MSQRITFRVHGQVQGVNFRSFTQKKASAYSLTGWVTNTSSGTVEGEAQGDSDSIKKLLKDLNNGPPVAHVTKLEKSEVEPQQGESSFQIK